MLTTLVLAAEEATLRDACGTDPHWMCELVFGWTDSALWAKSAERVVAAPITVLLVLALAFGLHRLVRRWVDRFVGRMESEIRGRVERGRRLGAASGSRRSETRRLQRLHAIGGAIRSGAGVLIWLVAILVSLAQFFDLRPILAGAGLAGLIVGFGAQNTIRDFLAGISMLVEDHYGVGDWIDVEGTVGEVEQVGLRTTRMRDIHGVVWHVPNGAMQKVGNLTQRWARATLDVPMALDTDIPRARDLVQKVADGLAADEEWGQDIIGPAEIWGLQEWGPSGMSLRLVVPTRPMRNWDVNRQLRERLKHAFDRAGIHMPVEMREIGAQRTGEPIRLSQTASVDARQLASAEEEEHEAPAPTTERLPGHRPGDTPDGDGGL